MERTSIRDYSILFLIALFMAGAYFSQAIQAGAEGLTLIYFLFCLKSLKKDSLENFEWILLVSISPFILSVIYGVCISSDFSNGWKEGKSSLHILMLPAIFSLMNKTGFRKCYIIFQLCFYIEFIWAIYNRTQGFGLDRIHGKLYTGTDGLFVSIVFLIAVHQLIHKKRGFENGSLAFCSFIFLILTKSRAPALACLILLPFMFIIYRVSIKKVVLLMLPLALSMLFVPKEAIRYFSNAAQTAMAESAEGQNMTSMGGRYQLWKASYISIKETNGIGTGYGDFKQDIENYINQGLIKPMQNHMHVHSLYLHALFCSGIIGLLGILITGYLILQKVNIYFEKPILIYVIAGHFLITGLFDAHFEHSKKIIFYSFCFCLACLTLKKKEKPIVQHESS